MAWYDEVRGSDVKLGKSLIPVPEAEAESEAEVLANDKTIELIRAEMAPHQEIVSDGRALIKGIHNDNMAFWRSKRVAKK